MYNYDGWILDYGSYSHIFDNYVTWQGTIIAEYMVSVKHSPKSVTWTLLLVNL